MSSYIVDIVSGTNSKRVLCGKFEVSLFATELLLHLQIFRHSPVRQKIKCLLDARVKQLKFSPKQ